MTMIGLMIGGQAAAMNVDLGDGTVVKGERYRPSASS